MAERGRTRTKRDPPFLVVMLADIEIASLERVQFGLKQFDLVLVFKEFTKALFTSILYQACSSTTLKTGWKGPVNLNWGPIMKTIDDSPYDFFRAGGWTFLGGTGDEVELQRST
ncbi:hypothetical protein BJV77DRAFT_960065 [Russula vinacea]|nr:hypothetical protein BJV77DRAFT_960065 [Russula vinacea]